LGVLFPSCRSASYSHIRADRERAMVSVASVTFARRSGVAAVTAVRGHSTRAGAAWPLKHAEKPNAVRPGMARQAAAAARDEPVPEQE